MVRLSGRSRGCATCRKRRIKCDEALPACRQCRRKNLVCPGPITDTFYIISSTGHRERSTGGSSTSTSPGTLLVSNRHPVASYDDNLLPRTIKQCPKASPSPHLEPHQAQAADYGWPQATTALPCKDGPGFDLPSYYQPSRAEPFDQLFFSHFFDTYGKPVESIRACSWLAHLPRLIATTFTSKAMKYSCRAVCMAFYGTLNGETSIRHEAQNFYVVALRSQLCEVYGKGHQASLTSAPSPEAICTSIMMAYFEQVTNNTGSAWEQHMRAACSMLEMRGPSRCADKFTYQLFRTVRLGMVYLAIIKNQTSTFAREEWMRVKPDAEQTTLDMMVEVLLSLSPHIAAIGQYSPQSHTEESERAQNAVRMRELAALLSRTSSPSFTSITPADGECPTHDAKGEPLFGCLRAAQDATRLIITHLMHAICDESERPLLHKAMVAHSAGVLSAIESVNKCTHSHASRIFVTTVFPLKIVAAWSPSQVYRACAQEYLGSSLHVA